MIVFLNGEFVSEDQALVSAFDRGFLYGDGVFETLRVANGQPFCWDDHTDRLRRGAQLLRLGLPFSAEQLRQYLEELLRRNALPEALLRLHVTRGAGPRGYSTRNAKCPTVVMSLHPAPPSDPAHPPRWRLATANVRLPLNDPLAEVKTCNKLPYILARAEAEAAGADAALLLNAAGEAAEADSANLFWIEQDKVFTPPLSSGALPGVTRRTVMKLCAAMGVSVAEKRTRVEILRAAGGVFLTLSTLGVVEVTDLDWQPIGRSPLTARLRDEYGRLLTAETTGAPATPRPPGPAF
jgi:branched-chain amino acid aminotransferase